MMKLDLYTLKLLYGQVRRYEDRQWIGFLIAVEERKLNEH